MAIELYVAETPDEVKATGSAQLSDFLEDASCANCDVVVGFDARKFFPCVICIEDEEDVWVVCLECASGVVYPGE